MISDAIEFFRQNVTYDLFLLGSLLILFAVIFIFYHRRYTRIRKQIILPVEISNTEKMLAPHELEQHMRNLSHTHKNVRWGKYNFFINDRNQAAYRELNKIRDTLSEVSPEIIVLIPAARWLFDNFQMLYREIKKVKATGDINGRLPVLNEGKFKGYPRVYVIAREMVLLSGGYLNESKISMMICAYQEELPLTGKELWGLPEMIGFCLLESVTVVARKIINVTEIKSKADAFVRKNLKEEEMTNVFPLLSELEDEFSENISFHSHVIYLLKNMSFDEASIQRYVEFHNKSKYLRPTDIFQEEGNLESRLESNIRTFLVSLRETVELDGEKLFEDLSIIERILSEDPDGVYPKMDSESRGRYRSIIERFSLKNKIDERVVAENCLAVAKNGRENLKFSHHVGTYLVGKGYPILKAKLLKKTEPQKLAPKWNIKGISYFLLVFVFVFIIYLFLGCFINRSGISAGIYGVLAFLFVSLVLVIGIAIELTNNIFTRLVHVRQLPALDFLEGVPEEARTFVVMPVIVSSVEQALEYIQRLERHYLANRQSNLFFALLVDFNDSKTLRMDVDEEIEEVLVNGINGLNDQYPFMSPRFSVFIRSRKWNESEMCYMGWERKRGKLEEFNALLCGEQETSFSTLLCDESMLNTFKYVITLDADSILLTNNASKLVGIIEHPLNQPVLDLVNSKVKDGYAIIQPSVTNHILNKKCNLFYSVFAGKQGLDRYSTIISDIYHDIFEEGIFSGKGIYHIKTFHTILRKSMPDNRVLSHDLLESCYVKTAFSGAVKIMDDFPGCVLSYTQREHRWIRGDWQLLPWLFKKKTLAGLSKWKILDNLRLSMVPLSKVLLIILNLVLMPEIYYLWLPMVFFTYAVDLFLMLESTLSQKINKPKLALVHKDLLKDIGLLIQRAVLDILFTPYRAYIALDAVSRTLYRLLLSKKNLLMWNTAEKMEKCAIDTPKGYFLHMWSSLVPSVIIVGLLFFVDIPFWGILLYALLSVGWGFSYLAAYKISETEVTIEKNEIDDNEKMIRGIARKTWQFFKDFSTIENNWFCPDNYQKEPTEKIAFKTSPTNIGLQLISVLSARDLGFETLGKTLEYLENILNSVRSLPKWNGHLFNWYDTRTLEVLNPRYVSTVDSGNFYAHLITLKNGLLHLVDEPLFSQELVYGLKDTIKLCNDGLEFKENFESIGEFIEETKKIRGMINSDAGSPRVGKCFRGELLSGIDLIIDEASQVNGGELSFSSGPTLRELTMKDNVYAISLTKRIELLVEMIETMLEDLDFRFLYNEKRKLFHIGYSLSTQKMDVSCYDLMASESILTSFLAIARDDVPLKHWYKLERPLTIVKGIPCFVSWSGTMFEYLMPNLVMREYEGSVFAETAKAAVLQHIEYGKRKGTPWGISESQYYQFDQESNYQYKAFGVPELRLQPSLVESLVVAPYATILALGYAKDDCFSNLKKLSDLGCVGDYGYYEAVDFNSPDPVAITPYSIIKSFMAHHQGMNLVAINNFIHKGIMQNRFHSEQMIHATQLLLEEKRYSYFISISRKGYNIQFKKTSIPMRVQTNRYVKKITPKIPAVHYLSVNNYSLMITSDGDGFSKYREMTLYRWKPDLYASTGSYIFIKDVSAGKTWSTSYNPTKAKPDEYQAILSPHQAEFKRCDGDISTHTVVSLSPSHKLEIRKVILRNNSKERKQIELTSYMEVVVDTFSAAVSHPAFNKLFIESTFIRGHDIFLSKRRGGNCGDNPYMMHMIKTEEKLSRNIEYENDRLKFTGRNNTIQNPDAVVESLPLSNSAGFSTDPIMSLRACFDLEAEKTATVYFITGVCCGEEEAVGIGDELNDVSRIEDLNVNFKMQTELELKYVDIKSAQFNAFQDLISPIFYPSRYYRGPRESIRRNWENQRDLWKFGVSGDNPIMLLRVSTIEEVGIIKDVVKAYEYFRINKINVDLIILSEAKYGYMQELDDLLNQLTTSLKAFDENKEKQSLFILHTYQMIPADIDLLLTVARVVFTEKTGIYFRTVKETVL